MRRTILLCAGVLLAVMLVAPPASGTPKGTGCPAEASIWTEISYITSPDQGDYTQTSFYQFYWVTHPKSGATFAAEFPSLRPEELYFLAVNDFIDLVYKNQDDTLCIFWLGGVGTPDQGLSDAYTSVVDNVTSAQR